MLGREEEPLSNFGIVSIVECVRPVTHPDKELPVGCGPPVGRLNEDPVSKFGVLRELGPVGRSPPVPRRGEELVP